jgi:hypothetical protein
MERREEWRGEILDACGMLTIYKVSIGPPPPHRLWLAPARPFSVVKKKNQEEEEPNLDF